MIYSAIFDEIQECSDALYTLKCFREHANNYHVITAGSLLGPLLTLTKSYPVSQVNIIEIEPLSFSEFLLAMDESLFAYYNNITE